MNRKYAIGTHSLEREPPSGVLATKDQIRKELGPKNGMDSDASLVSTQDGKSSSAFASNWTITTSPVSLASQTLREVLARKTVLPYCDCS